MYRCLSVCLAVSLLSPAALAKGKVHHRSKPVAHVLSSQAVPINTASLKEWLKLPGVGAKCAKKIVSYREKHGPFRSVNDLLKVSGVGKAKLKQWQNKQAGHPYVVLRALQ